MTDTERPHVSGEAVPPIGWLLAAAGDRAAGNFRSLLPDGVHPRQFAVMQLLSNAPQPLTQSEAARSLSIPASRIVAIVDQLEVDGLVVRQSDPHDRRTRHLALTRKGQAFLKGLAPVVEEANRRAVEPLTEHEQRQLLRLLAKIVRTPHIW